MAKIGVSLKINVSQIDKARLFSGQKGKYLDCTVFIDVNDLDQYGNSGMITQDVTKDEKAAGVKGNILGNCKVFWNEAGQAPQANQSGFQQQAPQQQAPQQKPQGYGTGPQFQQQQKVNPQEPTIDFNDDIPFALIGLPYNNMLIHCI